MSLLRKLTTRPVWNWEKRRPYPIRKRWHALPAVPATGPLPMVMLTTPGGFDDAMWAAWSWLRFMAADVRFDLVVDGEPTAGQRAGLERLCPGATLVTRRELLARIGAWPEGVRSFVERHRLGLKLGLILLYQERGRVLYLDSDVLAFHPPREILEAFRAGRGTCYLLDPGTGTFDQRLAETARARGIPPPGPLNSGVLLLDRSCVRLEEVERLLDGGIDASSWFTEQTLLALLLMPLGEPLPPHRYVVSTQRQFYWEEDLDYGAIAVRHFTGPTRHVMYLKGLPLLARASRW
jgi:hypothetical protein